MPDSIRILAVDAGNSRVKWALHDGLDFASEGACSHDKLNSLDHDWAALAQPDAVIIANVAGHAVGDQLRQSCTRWKLVPEWVEGRAQQCGVTSRYREPDQLGPDRWAALIGAHNFSKANCIVVCAGTATTIDALTDKGVFLGGMILPGYELMHSLLNRNTARLGPERGESVAFPRSTSDAITSGAIRATCGAIRCMFREMQHAGYTDVSVIATGGAARYFLDQHVLELHFSELDSAAIVVRDKLVLEGLVCIGNSTEK